MPSVMCKNSYQPGVGDHRPIGSELCPQATKENREEDEGRDKNASGGGCGWWPLS